MRVEKGTMYTCDVCNCELKATRSADQSIEDCDLSCCGQAMIEESSPTARKR